jgi:hypothetical protein
MNLRINVHGTATRLLAAVNKIADLFNENRLTTKSIFLPTAAAFSIAIYFQSIESSGYEVLIFLYKYNIWKYHYSVMFVTTLCSLGKEGALFCGN